LINGASLSELDGFVFETFRNHCFFSDPLLCCVFAHVFRDLHAAKMRAAHEAEVRSLGAFLWQGLTKLTPIIFALIGLVVNSSLCRLIPVGSIHHGLE
jgi:hypothetical protein